MVFIFDYQTKKYSVSTSSYIYKYDKRRTWKSQSTTLSGGFSDEILIED